MNLYNKFSAEENALAIDKSKEPRITLSFYKYWSIKNPSLFRDYLFIQLNEIGVFGRIYVAHEGINAQLSVSKKKFNEFKQTLNNIEFLKDVHLNIAIGHYDKSFLKLKIKVKDKIVADGLEKEEIDLQKKGTYLEAEKFNTLLNESDSICIDMRNHYESEVGHFKGAYTPDVDTFRESLPLIEEKMSKHKKDKKILLYCTGGIRCEKASAYFVHKGFENVYQLKGGIIEYARQVKENKIPSSFIGKNFVFDERLGERITEDIIAQCHHCGAPCDTHKNCANDSCHLLFIQCEDCANKMENCCSTNCKDIKSLSFEEQKELRKGKKNSHKVFKKGKAKQLVFKK